MVPDAAGVKLMASSHDSPSATVEVASQSGGVPLPASRVKFAATLRKLNISGALPSLLAVTVCGLSLLVAPTCVAAKASDGGSAKFRYSTAFVVASATTTFPFLSTAAASGLSNPLPRISTRV